LDQGSAGRGGFEACGSEDLAALGHLELPTEAEPGAVETRGSIMYNVDGGSNEQ
jgi:hypothetical protein